MRLTGFRLLAASSLLCALSASAAARPRYGGTLHVQMRAAPTSLDPADLSQPDWFESRNLFSLVFDTMVSLGDQGKPEPALATAWQSEPGDQRWQFFLRHGVTFQDGTPVTPDAVAASLRRTNPTWKVFSDGEAVVIERDSPATDLPAELTMLRNSIVKRDGAKLFGTGPFAISAWDPGRELSLAARDDYWGARAFLDGIEIDMGKSFREQLISFDLGKTQAIEVAPEQAHRAAAEGRRVQSSGPVELVALVFDRQVQSPEDGRQRQALALGIDRDLLSAVVLQGGGEPTGGLLPNWMSGYGFLFPAAINLDLARQVRSGIPHTTSWNLGYDANDPVERVIAERIVLNARDAGLGLQITSAKNADVRIARVPLISLDAQIAVGDLAEEFGLTQPKFASGSVDDLYNAENKLLQSQRVIPLLHLRVSYALSDTVKDWSLTRDGRWHAQNAWLAAAKP